MSNTAIMDNDGGAITERPGPLARIPFSYYGGKVGLAPRIVELMPEHRVYMEPFFGSGAVFFAKERARFEILNDLDDNVTTFFRVLRERPEDLEMACTLTPHARTEFVGAELDEDLDDLERARRFWVRINQSFGKTAGRRTGWSITTTRSTSVPSSIRSRITRFAAVADRLLDCSIENCDAADLIERLATPDTLIYCDPPYLADTRRGRERSRPADYRCDMGDPEAHERLAEVLHATEATVMLSGYHSPLYDRLFGDWWRIEWPVKVHASNAVTSERGDRVEVLWANRDLTLEPELVLFGNGRAETPPGPHANGSCRGAS